MIWLNPESTPDGTIDSVVFDVDGVLIDVRGSYRMAVIAAVEYALSSIYGHPSPISYVTLDDVAAFKKAGGFNNDWDLTYALTALSLARVRDPGHWKAPLAAYAAQSGGRGLSWVQEVVPSQCLPEYEVTKQIMNEFYWGTGRYAVQYGQPSRYSTDEQGLVATEIALMPSTLIDELRSRQVQRFGIITGRVEMEVMTALETLGYGKVSPFQAILRGDQLSKPNPKALAFVAHALGSKRGVYVGDTTDDLRLVQFYNNSPLAGDTRFYSVMISDEESLTHFYQHERADAVTDHVQNLPEILAGWGQSALPPEPLGADS